MEDNRDNMSLNPVIENGIKRRADIATIIIFLCLIFVLAVWFWVIPDNKFSEDENRSLQQMPESSIENLFSGRFAISMRNYCADQFPFRDSFVGAKTLISYAFLINENKGAVIAKNDYIIQRFDIYSEYTIAEKSAQELGGNLAFSENMLNIRNNCKYINEFYKNFEALYRDSDKDSDNVDNPANFRAVPHMFIFAVPPRKIDVMTNKLPAFFPTDHNEIYFDELNQNINKDIYFDLTNIMQSKNDEYIYYKTDHHWTTLGAYYAYAALGEKMGYTPIQRDGFTIEIASDNFYGITWSKSGAKWTSPDIIEYYRTPDDEKLFKTEIRNQSNPVEFSAFYDREKLNTKDKYASFLGGINSHTSVWKTINSQPPPYQSKKRVKLLIIMDSFGQCLVPFLAQHYDIEIIDLRFFNDNIYDFIKENEIANVLILQNMENLSTQNNLIKLTRK